MKINTLLCYLFCIVYLMLNLACNNDTTIPKPRGFQRIEFPEKQYKPFKSDCNFSTVIPTYGYIFPDTFPGAEKCWYNIYYEPFNATLHLSYKPISSSKSLYKLIEDSRTLVYKHTIKADEIYETVISNNILSGMLYNISGNTATNFQFYVTDSNNHFLRGSLYFNVKTNSDSIAPVLHFIEKDIYRMIESLTWTKS